MEALKTIILFAAALSTGRSAVAAVPDPTRPYTGVPGIEVQQSSLSGGKVKWRLRGIQINEEYRRAILNGRLVKVGDKIRGATVLEIRKSEILLLTKGRRLVVKLLNPDVKKPADKTEDD